MKETAKAKRAWLDYLEMGPERSLRDLIARYQARAQTAGRARAKVPTIRLASLEKWSVEFGWQERLQEIVAREQAAIEARGIADRQNRVDALNDIHKGLLQIKAERAADSSMADVPGGKTGLLVRQVKLVKLYSAGEEGGGDADQGATEYLEGQAHGGALLRRRSGDVLESIKRSVEVEEFALDTGLVRSILDVQKQAAQELDQWQEKQVQVHSGEVTHVHGVDDEAASAIADLIARGISSSPAQGSGAGPTGVGGPVSEDPGSPVRADRPAGGDL